MLWTREVLSSSKKSSTSYLCNAVQLQWEKTLNSTELATSRNFLRESHDTALPVHYLPPHLPVPELHVTKSYSEVPIIEKQLETKTKLTEKIGKDLMISSKRSNLPLVYGEFIERSLFILHDLSLGLQGEVAPPPTSLPCLK